MSETPLTPSHFYRRDPLLHWLLQTRRLNPQVIIVGVVLLTLGVLMGGPLSAGAAVDQEAQFTGLLQSLLIFPIGMAIMFYLPESLAGLFNALEHTIAREPEPEAVAQAYTAFTQDLAAWANSRWWTGLALLIVALYWLYRLFGKVSGDITLPAPEPARLWLRLAILVLYSPLLYEGLLSVGRLLAGLRFTGLFLRQFTLRLSPLAPDSAAGLGVVGQRLVVSVLIATAFGAASAGIISIDLSAGRNPFARPETVALGCVYLLLTPLLFWEWLWGPHRALLETRDRMLQRWAEEFLRAIPQAAASLEGEAAAIKTHTDRLSEIKQQYDLISDSFPVWPIRLIAVRSLVATSVLPLVSSLISSFLPNIRDAVLVLFKIGKP